MREDFRELVQRASHGQPQDWMDTGRTIGRSLELIQAPPKLGLKRRNSYNAKDSNFDGI